MKKLLKLSILVLIINFPFLLNPQKSLAAPIILQDNFDDGNSDGWVVTRNTCSYNMQPANWEVINNKIGLRINGGSCATEIMPDDTLWGAIGNNYSVDFDMTLVSGTDHNFAFRYSNPDSWYGIHIQSPDILWLERVLGPYTKGVGDNFSNGQTIHFRIEILGEHIKIYKGSPPLLILDYPDAGSVFPTGRIALRATAGGDPVSETWFDNIVVTSFDETTPTLTPIPSTPTPTLPPPTPTPPTPVVFLPGIGASFNFKEMFLNTPDPGEWQMTPGTKVYQNLILSFEDYSDFHIFYYDWRKPIMDNAQKLNDYIKNQINPLNNQVNLIGHSLGGLVARTCVQKTENKCYADKVITVGSPHQGAVQIYPVVEAGEVWGSNIVDMSMRLFLHYHQQVGETSRATANRIAPVIQDLVPVFDFLKKDGSPIYYGDLSVKNLFLPQLTDYSSLKNKTTMFWGNSFDTYGNITVTEPSWLDKILGNWPDGKPTGSIDYENGDLTVLAKSAVINDPDIGTQSYDFDHSRLMSDPVSIQKIFELLTIPFPDVSLNPTVDEKNYLIFFVHSPVAISSPDVTEDSFANPEMIIIPNPQNKTYQLNILGLSSSYYRLSVGQLYSDRVIWTDFLNQAYAGSQQTFSFAINPQDPKSNPLVDPSGQITAAQLAIKISEFKKEVSDLPIKPGYKQILIGIIDQVSKESNTSPNSFYLLFALRQKIDSFEKKTILNPEISITFRNKTFSIAETIETLLFAKPLKTNKPEAQNFIKSAEKTRSQINTDKVTKEFAFVYLEAQKKLASAKENFARGKYYFAKIYAIEADLLFKEVISSTK